MISVLPVWDDASLQLRSCLPVHIPASGRPPSPSPLPQSLRTKCAMHRPASESPPKRNLLKTRRTLVRLVHVHAHILDTPFLPAKTDTPSYVQVPITDMQSLC